jgi:hypothetical protein
MDSTIAARRAAERWFLDRGLPSVITRRARLRAIWPRSAPALAAFATLELCFLVIDLLTGRPTINIDSVDTTAVEWVVLTILALTLPLVSLVGWIVARMQSNRSQAIVSTVSVAVALASPAIEAKMRLVIVTAIVIATILVLTVLGIGSVLGWALKLTLSQLKITGALMIRALPVVLLTVLVFFNTYVWIMSATISRARLWSAIAFLVVIAAVFVISGTMDKARPSLEAATASAKHAEGLEGTPFAVMEEPKEADPLTFGEKVNVEFVLATTQLVQIAMVAVVTASIFFVLGLIVLSPELLAAWTHNARSDGRFLGMTVPVPDALIQMTMFLAALTFMYIGARAVGDGEHRKQLLDPIIHDLKLTLLARNRYRASGTR